MYVALVLSKPGYASNVLRMRTRLKNKCNPPFWNPAYAPVASPDLPTCTMYIECCVIIAAFDFLNSCWRSMPSLRRKRWKGELWQNSSAVLLVHLHVHVHVYTCTSIWFSHVCMCVHMWVEWPPNCWDWQQMRRERPREMDSHHQVIYVHVHVHVHVPIHSVPRTFSLLAPTCTCTEKTVILWTRISKLQCTYQYIYIYIILHVHVCTCMRVLYVQCTCMYVFVNIL